MYRQIGVITLKYLRDSYKISYIISEKLCHFVISLCRLSHQSAFRSTERFLAKNTDDPNSSLITRESN